jgi:hypothetical protein
MVLSAMALLAAPALAGAREAPPMELVHVTANTGFSAGGHIALHVGSYAYHFEVWEDGWLRLGREDWELFRLRYGTLENRGMAVTGLELDTEARSRMQRELLALWSRQSADLAELAALETARDWAAHREGAEPPLLPGVGFFERGSDGDPHAETLRDVVSERLSAGRLTAEREHIEGELAKWRAGNDPQALRDTLAVREALLALRAARGLAATAVVDPEAGFDEPLPMTAAERKALAALARQLEDTVARLLVSPRPDRGRPLLLAMARYQAVRRSLDQGRLLLLDALSSDDVAIATGESDGHRRLVERLAQRAADGWRAERARTFAGSLDEPAYNALEEAATGVTEMRAALSEGRPIRIRALGRLVPARPGRLSPSPAFAGASQDEIALAQAREDEFRARLAERYRYDLVLRNCSTELASVLRLGAPDIARDGTRFVPALLSHDVGSSELAGERSRLPSHRRAQVALLAEREGRLRVGLRESNTLTSTVYEGSLRDDHFLFFADGSPWLRPLQGTANLAYGLGHAAVGLVTAPIDRGHRLRGGLEGAFYSLPELVGVSIRKGRYDLVPLQR